MGYPVSKHRQQGPSCFVRCQQTQLDTASEHFFHSPNTLSETLQVGEGVTAKENTCGGRFVITFSRRNSQPQW